MSGDPDPPFDPERTVFLPGPGGQPTSAPGDPETGETPTMFQAGRTAGPAGSQSRAWAAPAGGGPAAQVGPGSILNNIYEVRRFLARGGMGEVYEGVNVNTDERVAIKVILPALAADPNVQALFRKEARTLTRLHHPALVQYRVLAQEPGLGVLYIVTEFIDGSPLSNLLSTLNPTPEQLARLTRRLAEGLGAAHLLGAVHRDMSPDNVLVPEGRLEQAKIIDFGIAKEMGPGRGTIVGDGFAGKLNYVAPEQLGDFNREVGPWTDAYSLGLVILAAAIGRDVDMGATLVEAVDRRRAGPDLAAAPTALRPILARMLAADPARRLRSMEEVIAALDAPSSTASAAQAAPPAPSPPSGPRAPRSPRGLLIGAAAAILLVAAGGAIALLTLGRPKPPVEASAAAGKSPGPQLALRQSLEQALPTVTCSWLDLDHVENGQSGAEVRLRGVAGRPSAVQAAISAAAKKAAVPLANLDLDEVAPVGEALCAPLDVFRPLRTADAGVLSTPQRRFEIARQADSGKLAARAVVDLRLPGPAGEIALVGLEPNGKMTVLIPDRAAFKAATGRFIEELSGSNYRLVVNTDHAGWSGILLIASQAPIQPKLLEGDPAGRSADWPEGVRAAAARDGWKTDMVWYRTVRAGE
jgi:serine/threonine-protein kinase